MSFLSPCRAALLQSSRRTSRVSTANRSLLATQWYQQRNASTKHPKGFAPPTQDDLEELRERTVEFARREIPQDVAQAVDHTNEFPNDMWKKMGEAGFLGITADEDYGGLAMGYQAHCTVMKELSRASGKIEHNAKMNINMLLTILQDQSPSHTQPTVNSASTSSCSTATKTKKLATSQA